MQFVAQNKIIQCPVCDSRLSMVREYDARVAIMQHHATQCPRGNKKYRVDRLTGYGEHHEEKPAEVQFPSRGIAPIGT